MNRRQATLALSAMVALMSGKAKTEPETASSGSMAVADWSKPKSVIFNIGDFKDFTFTYDEKSVKFTPQEMFDALNEK